VGKLIGVVATIVVAIAAATGVGFAVSNASSQDKSVNLENPDPPNGMNSGSGEVNYGTTP
jgi:type 1 fimbria pilin